MGWFKNLFNIKNAEGCREAMRLSYQKHLRLARQGMVPTDDSPHYVGLYGALGSRYKTRGIPVMEVVIWAELVPFLLMRETDAVEALAEYVVYQERDRDAKVSWLRKLINDVLRMAPTSAESPRSMAPRGIINQVAWCDLLDPDVKMTLEEEAQKITSAFNENADV